MPIYEYACQACGHCFEVLQGIDEAALMKCPECKKSRLQKLVSATSFQLKGNGWYVTDFKNANKKTTTTDAEQPKAKEKTEKSSTDTGSAASTAG